MKPFRPLLLLWLGLLCGSFVNAAEIGIVTLVEGAPLLLRGATWYKLPPGARLEDGDILEAAERAQVQVELADGSAANLAGPASLYLAPPPARAGGPAGSAPLVLPRGWLKIASKGRGLQLRLTTVEIALANAIVVVHTQGPSVELFVESGDARVMEFLRTGVMAAARDVKRGEFWSKQVDALFQMQPRAPKAFVDAMPRHFVDPLPSLAHKFRTKPVLAEDHHVTYAEAEPWLVGRDRAVFEKRFASRLRDPAFRKAVEPNVARYPTWDRMLHPEKYAARPKTTSTPPAVGRTY